MVNDTRVVEKNPNGPIVTVADFCEPVVDRDVFDRVQHLRRVRVGVFPALRAGSDEPGKLIAAVGLTLKYLLTGLCGAGAAARRCGRARPGTRRRRARRMRTCMPPARGRCGGVRQRPGRSRGPPARGGRRRLRFPPVPAPGRTGPGARGIPTSSRPRQANQRHPAPPNRTRGAIREAELRELGERLTGGP